MTAAIHTPRLRLRPSREEDLSALHALWTEPEVRRYLWDGEVIPRERAMEILAKSEESFRRRGFGIWAAFVVGEPGLAGFAGLRVVGGTEEVEILYGLHPRVWGLGLATEAADALIAHAFARAWAQCIWARADAPNEASVAVMKRLGMKPSPSPGSESGLVSYAITATEYAGFPDP